MIINKTRLWLRKKIGEVGQWAGQRYYAIAVFNLITIFLFLLHSVGYFHPYFPISINVIVLAMFFLAVVLLRIPSTAFFIITLFFWLISMFFKLVQVNIWAERSGIYVYQALFVGVILLILENGSFFKRGK